MDNELARYLNEAFSLELKESTYDQLKIILVVKINELINNDFSKLIHLLYKADVNEAKLKRLLKENDASHAAEIIASLIIERQMQKINSRRESRRDNDFDEEEKW
jgi:hypothetical protein